MVPDVSCYIRSRCVAERMISCVKLVDITQNIKARTAMRKGVNLLWGRDMVWYRLVPKDQCFPRVVKKNFFFCFLSVVDICFILRLFSTFWMSFWLCKMPGLLNSTSSKYKSVVTFSVSLAASARMYPRLCISDALEGYLWKWVRRGIPRKCFWWGWQWHRQ